MSRLIASVFSLLIMALSICSAKDANVDGVYMFCHDIQAWSGEVLELQKGRFRYWAWSDVMTKDRPEYPLAGKFSIRRSRLTLKHKLVPNPVRVITELNGVAVVWQKQGLKLWNEKHRMASAFILVRAFDPPYDQKQLQLMMPLIERILMKDSPLPHVKE
jgi:hypothetical protein